jgi:hypothetical protein
LKIQQQDNILYEFGDSECISSEAEANISAWVSLCHSPLT